MAVPKPGLPAQGPRPGLATGDSHLEGMMTELTFSDSFTKHITLFITFTYHNKLKKYISALRSHNRADR